MSRGVSQIAARRQKRDRPGVGSARDYLHSMQDAHTFLRYAERALADAKRSAPDHLSMVDISKVHANCEVVFGQAKEARNRTLSRYTPKGEPKGNRPATKQPRRAQK